MTKRRRKYTQEFKEKTIKLVLDHEYKIAEAAKNLVQRPFASARSTLNKIHRL